MSEFQKCLEDKQSMESLYPSKDQQHKKDIGSILSQSKFRMLDGKVNKTTHKLSNLQSTKYIGLQEVRCSFYRIYHMVYNPFHHKHSLQRTNHIPKKRVRNKLRRMNRKQSTLMPQNHKIVPSHKHNYTLEIINSQVLYIHKKNLSERMIGNLDFDISQIKISIIAICSMEMQIKIILIMIKAYSEYHRF